MREPIEQDLVVAGRVLGLADLRVGQRDVVDDVVDLLRIVVGSVGAVEFVVLQEGQQGALVALEAIGQLAVLEQGLLRQSREELVALGLELDVLTELEHRETLSRVAHSSQISGVEIRVDDQTRPEGCVVGLRVLFDQLHEHRASSIQVVLVEVDLSDVEEQHGQILEVTDLTLDPPDRPDVVDLLRSQIDLAEFDLLTHRGGDVDDRFGGLGDRLAVAARPDEVVGVEDPEDRVPLVLPLGEAEEAGELLDGGFPAGRRVPIGVVEGERPCEQVAVRQVVVQLVGVVGERVALEVLDVLLGGEEVIGRIAALLRFRVVRERHELKGLEDVLFGQPGGFLVVLVGRKPGAVQPIAVRQRDSRIGGRVRVRNHEILVQHRDVVLELGAEGVERLHALQVLIGGDRLFKAGLVPEDRGELDQDIERPRFVHLLLEGRGGIVDRGDGLLDGHVRKRDRQVPHRFRLEVRDLAGGGFLQLGPLEQGHEPRNGGGQLVDLVERPRVLVEGELVQSGLLSVLEVD